VVVFVAVVMVCAVVVFFAVVVPVAVAVAVDTGPRDVPDDELGTAVLVSAHHLQLKQRVKISQSVYMYLT